MDIHSPIGLSLFSAPTQNRFKRFKDSFTGSSLNSKWQVFDPNSSISGSVPTVANGEMNLRILAGGADPNSSFWFDANEGCLVYQEINGAFDARAKVRVRADDDDTSNPNLFAFEIAGLAVHDPDRTDGVYNYLHIGLGGTATGNPRREWKTNDDINNTNDTSAFQGQNFPSGGGLLDGDLRIVRRASNLQVFDLYTRERGTDLPLTDNSDWNFYRTIDREDNTTPDRDAFGASENAAVALPSSLQLGFIVYSNVASSNIQMFVEDFIVLPSTS